MDHLNGSPLCGAGGSGSARAEGSLQRWAPTCASCGTHLLEGHRAQSAGAGTRGKAICEQRTDAGLSQWMGSGSLSCKDTQRRRINFHLLRFSTSDCIQPFGLLTPLPLPVPDKLMNFR